MIKIIIDNKIPFIKEILAEVIEKKIVEVEFQDGDKISNSLLKDVNALIIRTRTKCNENLLKGTAVEFIASATVGVDHIDMDFCLKNKIKVVNSQACNSSSVKQYVAAALNYIAEKQKISLKNKTLGIVGVGNIGKQVLKVAQAFEMKILLNDLPREQNNDFQDGFSYVSLDKLLAESDIVTLHVPLTKNGDFPTYHLINQKNIALMKPTATLINSSRGAVVDNLALADALQKKTLQDAILDVFENEPEIPANLHNLLTIATPHIAGYSADAKLNATISSVEKLAQHFEISELKKPFSVKSLAPPPISLAVDENLETEKILSQAISTAYNIYKDDENLRISPQNFENLRNNYPIRRDFESYLITLPKAHPAHFPLNLLGFRTASL